MATGRVETALENTNNVPKVIPLICLRILCNKYLEHSRK